MKNINETECTCSCTGNSSYKDLRFSVDRGQNCCWETCLYDLVMVSFSLKIGG